jgi:hypothetical protein
MRADAQCCRGATSRFFDCQYRVSAKTFSGGSSAARDPEHSVTQIVWSGKRACSCSCAAASP